MLESESGGIFRPPMPPESPPSPVNIIFVSYSSVVTDVASSSGSGIAVVHRNTNISDTDVTSSTGGGGGSAVVHRNISINDHGGGGGEMMMRKRGRPRKHWPNGGLPPQAVGAATRAFERQPQAAAAPPVYTAAVGSVPVEEGVALVKRGGGRPPGSSEKKYKPESLGGFCFTPHIVVVQPGEDVLNKVMSFTLNGSRVVCIISGIGVISNVRLHQATTSGGTTTYEGRFDILALSGSFVLSEGHGPCTRTGGLSVTLSGSDDQVFGGVVAGLLTAACPVQVVVGSLLPEPVLANYGEPLVLHRRSQRLTMARYLAAHRLMGP